MLGWGRSGDAKAKAAAAPSSYRAPPAESVDVATVLDTLVEILRAYGKHAFDTEEHAAEETRERTQLWVRHLSTGAPHPDREDEPATGARDWRGASTWVAETRRQESQYVIKSLADLRHVIWSFVHSVHQVIVDDEQADRAAHHQLQRLQVAVETSSTEALKREALSAVANISGVLEARKSRQRSQMAELGSQLRSLSRQLEDAKRAGALDPLTGLANRKAFDEFLARSIELHALMGQEACLLLADVDRFKGVNDTYGHLVGDNVLRRLSGCMARTFLRRCDFVSRFGGEEFAIVLHETPLKDGARMAERLVNSVRALTFEGDAPGLTVSLSVGVAALRVGEQSAAWIERADRALYQAKQCGRDRVIAAKEDA